jgi:hypothetical protein
MKEIQKVQIGEIAHADQTFPVSSVKIHEGVLYAMIVIFAATFLALIVQACSPGQAKTATSLAVRIADDVCKEVQNTPADLPDWVELACQAEGVAAPIVRVLMPKQQWHETRMATKSGVKDAGPGK